MSFYNKDINKGTVYQPGYFLAREQCTRITYQFKADDKNVVTADNGGKYIPAGTVISDDEGYVKGIVYEDVDVTYGDMPGSLVTAGTIYEDLLKGDFNKDNLEMAGGFFVIEKHPTIERPEEFGIADIELPQVEEAKAEADTKADENTADQTAGE